MNKEYIKCGQETFQWEAKPLGKSCNICKKELPIVSLTTQHLKLCKNCFNKIQSKRVLEGITKFKMFSKNDKIGILLSGGKDSATLAHILKNLFPDYLFYGIHINLGIKYYSQIAQKAVESLCEKLSLPLYIYNLFERDGFCIDDFMLTNFKNKICSVCGTVKRYLFSKIAKELNLTVIATGHHLDDLTSTYLTLFLNGDFSSIKRLFPINNPLYPGQAKKIKPLYCLPEREIFYYAVLNELPLESCGCPHGELTPSKKVKNFIEEFSKENKTFKYQLLSVFLEKFIPLLKTEEENINFHKCHICGEFTTSVSEVCTFCRRKELLKEISHRNLEITHEEWLKIANSEEVKEWIVFDLKGEEDYLENTKELFRKMKPYKNKKILLTCYTGRRSYLFTLALRKMGFEAYSLTISHQG